MENFVCLFTSRKWFLMRRMPVPKAAPTLSHQKKAYSFIVQKQHVSTGLSLRPKENVPAFFLAEKSIFLKTHTRAHAHTHTHTHTSPFLSLSLYHLKNQDLSLEFLVLKKSWRLLLTEKGPELSVTHTHTHRVTWRLTAGRTLCVFPRTPVTLSVHLHAHTLTFGKKRAPHPLRV